MRFSLKDRENMPKCNYDHPFCSSSMRLDGPGGMGLDSLRRFVSVIIFIGFVTTLLFHQHVNRNRIVFRVGDGAALSPYPADWHCPIFPRSYGPSDADRTIFVITPSKRQLTQVALLTRLSQTLRTVQNVHWIVVEDADQVSPSVGGLLKRSCHPYTHIALSTSNLTNKRSFNKSKGMPQRNAGLAYLRHRFHLLSNDSVLDTATNRVYGDSRGVGVVYFGDDDNTYDVRLFDFMRRVRTLGVWAVAFVGGASVEHPKVVNETVSGWNVAYMKNRKFATDMAGFAVNLERVLRWQNASFHGKCRATLYETCFLEQLRVNLSDVQPFGFAHRDMQGDKFRIFVWHTKTGSAGHLKNKHTDFEI